MKNAAEKAYERGKVLREQQQNRVNRMMAGERLNRKESIAYLSWFPVVDRRRFCFEARTTLAPSVVKEYLSRD